MRAETLGALGQFDDAVADLEAALVVAEAHAARPTSWRMRLALGILLYGHDQQRATSELATARAIVEELAADIPGTALRQQFLDRATALFPTPRRLTSLQATKREFDGITARQREVAALIARGRSNREIADALSLSERTIESHVTSILATLNFSARSQIAAWAVEKGLTGHPATE